MDSSTSRGSYVYNTAINYLPTSATWDNTGLISMNGNVTRFIDREDIKEACGSYTAGNYFETCQFFLEHSRFQNKNLGRAGIWIEKYNDTLYRIHTEALTAITAPDAESNNTARPVIEIPSYAIEGYKIKQQYHIDFDEDGGSSVADFDRYEGDVLGTLETPTKTGYIFDGWYTDPDDGEGDRISASTLVTGNVTYYAHWVKIICQKAATGTLHTETCDSSGSCHTKGFYETNATITYGAIPGVYSPRVGDAYDCDVNDDGTYDPLTERFYYIR